MPSLRSLVSALLIASIVFVSGRASAQVDALAAPYPPTRDLRAADELDSIHRELSTSSQLFVQAAIALEVGTIFVFMSSVFALTDSNARLDVFGAPLRTFELLGGLGGAFLGIGVLSLPFAIALYVDADARRGRAGGLVSVRLGPSGLSLSGRFP